MALRLFIFLIGNFSEIPIKKISLSEVHLGREVCLMPPIMHEVCVITHFFMVKGVYNLTVSEITINIPVSHESNVSGAFDSNIKIIEKSFGVDIVSRDGITHIKGNKENIRGAVKVMEQLLALSLRGTDITEQQVNYAVSIIKDPVDGAESLESIDKEIIAHTVNGKPVKPKTIGQKKYVDLIKKDIIVFGLGPAGTGKTYLAMAMAIQAFKDNKIERIILTRPAIEAGEKLGFLPGDLQSKVDPYLRPLYDALNQIMGAETFQANAEKGLIEVAPLAYMRGRTLDNAFIILDEAQNTTPAQMKMFLTRIGFGSKVVITGDLTQKDLANGTKSGLEEAVKILKNIEGIGFSNLTNKDVVRHPLVQKIVTAYDEYEKKNLHKENKRSYRR